MLVARDVAIHTLCPLILQKDIGSEWSSSTRDFKQPQQIWFYEGIGQCPVWDCGCYRTYMQSFSSQTTVNCRVSQKLETWMQNLHPHYQVQGT